MASGQTFTALREFSARGRTYKPGDVVDHSDWPHRRAELLESRNFVRRSVPSTRTYVALRAFPVGNIEYKKGDVLQAGLPQPKLDQLFELRYVTYTDIPQSTTPSASVQASKAIPVASPKPVDTAPVVNAVAKG